MPEPMRNQAGEKLACVSCINGHRVSSCQHYDRDLHVVRRAGRPRRNCAICAPGACTCPPRARPSAAGGSRIRQRHAAAARDYAPVPGYPSVQGHPSVLANLPATADPSAFAPAPASPSAFAPAPVSPSAFALAPVSPSAFAPAPVSPSAFAPAPVNLPAPVDPSDFAPVLGSALAPAPTAAVDAAHLEVLLANVNPNRLAGVDPGVLAGLVPVLLNATDRGPWSPALSAPVATAPADAPGPAPGWVYTHGPAPMVTAPEAQTAFPPAFQGFVLPGPPTASAGLIYTQEQNASTAQGPGNLPIGRGGGPFSGGPQDPLTLEVGMNQLGVGDVGPHGSGSLPSAPANTPNPASTVPSLSPDFLPNPDQCSYVCPKDTLLIS